VIRDASGSVKGLARELEGARPAWAAPLFGFEIEVPVANDETLEGGARRTSFRELPSTPPLERDLAFVLPPALLAVQVSAVMERVGGALLESATLFDEYRSAELAGRSAAWHLVFRAADRTLRDGEVDQIVSRILAALKEELDVRLRES
jgi:phenylalanyl-tRNA synthetase beta chain